MVEGNRDSGHTFLVPWSHPSTCVCDTQQRGSHFWSSLLLHQPCHGCTCSLQVGPFCESNFPPTEQGDLATPASSPGLVFRLGVLIPQGLDTLLSHIS